MELWNVGPPQADQKDISHLNFFVNPAGGTIYPTLHFPLRARFQPVGLQAGGEARTHCSAIPLFHHSNCERSELISDHADWLKCTMAFTAHHWYC
jgi:hypothetical protein